MFDLKCKRQDCEYNKNCNCTKKNVEIKKDTSCSSYVRSENSETEVEKIGQPAVRKNISVECSAKCLFSKDSSCEANGITVQTLDNRHCPNCCTYMPK